MEILYCCEQTVLTLPFTLKKNAEKVYLNLIIPGIITASAKWKLQSYSDHNVRTFIYPQERPLTASRF